MCGIEIDLVLASGSNLTCFLCGCQNRHRVCMRAENCLVLIYRSKLTWFWAWGAKLTWFLCVGRKWLVFGVGIDWVSLCAGWSKLTWFLYAGWKSPGFSVIIELDFVSVRVVEINLISLWGSNLTWFSAGIGIDLVLMWGSKIAWFSSGDRN